jgi:ribosome-associated protein
MAKKAVKKTAKKTTKAVVSDKAEKLAYICAKTADDHKAENVMTLKVSGLSVIADYFVLCTGNSIPHISAISDSIIREVREKMELRPRGIDGVPSSLWTVIDYGSVIVHVLSPKMREQYNLESLWGDAPKIETLKLLAKKSLS